MKQKHLIIRYFFAIALLGSIVAQSFHGYEHIQRQFSEKICWHKHNNSSELTHHHKGFEQCLVCAISFQSGITTKHFFYQALPIPTIGSNYFFVFENSIFFSGSLYSLRGPPQHIV